MKIIKAFYVIAFFMGIQSLIATDIIRPDHIDEDIGALKDKPIPEEVKKRFRDPLLNAEPIRLPYTLIVTSVQFNPKNNNQLAVGSNDRTAKIWNVTTGNVLKIFQHDHWVTSVAWSPDGTKLATGFWGGPAQIWDAASSVVPLRILPLTTFKPASDINAMAWSSDNKLAIASDDGTIRIWNIVTNDLLQDLDNGLAVAAVAWSPDGRKLAIGSRDGSAKVWDAVTNKLLYTVKHTKEIYSVAWSPDGKKLATGSWDGAVKISKAASGALLKIFNKHASGITALAWSPDDTKLATGSHDQTTKIWDVANGDLLRTFKGAKVTAVAWSPDGTKLAIGDYDGAKIWTVQCDLTKYRPIDYQVLYFLNHHYNPAHPINVAQFPALRTIIATAAQPMQLMMKKFISTMLPEEIIAELNLEERDAFFDMPFKDLIAKQFNNNKAFIIAAIPFTDTEYNFYDAQGLSKVALKPANQLVDPRGNLIKDPNKVLYFIATKEKSEFTYIGSLKDLRENNERGRKMRVLLMKNTR